MTSRRPSTDRDLGPWLAAERDGRTADAEAALVELFHDLPRLAPRHGFSGRVRRAIRASAEPADWPARHWERMVVGGSLVLTSTVLALLSPLVLFAASASRLADALVLAGRVLGLVSSGADLGLRVWALLASVGKAAAVALSTPLGASLVLGHVLVALVSVVVLRRLLAPHQEAV